MARILVVDDDASMRDSLRRVFVREGHEVEDAVTMDVAAARLTAGGIDLLLTDIRLGESSGLDLIALARRQSTALRIVAMTGFGSVNVAVDAMRLGADDFLEKPFRIDTILRRIARALEPAQLAGEVARLRSENELLRDELEFTDTNENLVGSSAGLQRVKELIARVAPSEANVLIRGESGTGKELVARQIHRRSLRADRPFVAFDCNAFAEGVIESELFGHEKGAFTGAERRRIGRFELADTGTLFLDEVGELAATVQVKLLRVLQQRAFERVGGNETIRVDVRVIAATNRDLEAAMQESRFRDDLYYRLNVVTIEVPPLRERAEDIPALVALFLARYGQRPDGSRVTMAPDAMSALQAYPWAGNVRQLENVIHRGAVLCHHDVIRVEDVTLELRDPGVAPSGELDLRSVLATVERDLIGRAVREHHGNLTAAGRSLGIERNLLRYKLRKYGLRS
jgi:two-component system, NtrC family, response regulator HydG